MIRRQKSSESSEGGSPDGSGDASPLGDGEGGAPLDDRCQRARLVWMIDGKGVAQPRAPNAWVV